MDAVRNSFGEFYPVHLLYIFPYIHYPFYRSDPLIELWSVLIEICPESLCASASTWWLGLALRGSLQCADLITSDRFRLITTGMKIYFYDILISLFQIIDIHSSWCIAGTHRQLFKVLVIKVHFTLSSRILYDVERIYFQIFGDRNCRDLHWLFSVWTLLWHTDAGVSIKII